MICLAVLATAFAAYKYPDPSKTCRPLVGGSQIVIGCGFLCLHKCTAGFAAVALSSDFSRVVSYGITTAGHCGSVGNYVYQPAWSLFVNNHVATVARDNDLQINGLYARKLDNVNITNKVLKCSPTGYARVVGFMPFFSEIKPRVDRGERILVTKYKAVTRETSGYIVGAFYNITFNIEGRLVTRYYQLIIDGMRAEKGDSGAPVYEDPYYGGRAPFEPWIRLVGVV